MKRLRVSVSCRAAAWAVVLCVGGMVQPTAKAQSQQKTPQPAVVLSPSTLSFGKVEIGRTSLPQTVVLTNTGNATLDISAITIANPTIYPIYKSCPTTLAAGSSCNFAVAFSPTAPGLFVSQVKVFDNAPGSPQVVTVSASSDVPGVALSPTQVNFGTVAEGGTSASQTVTVTNQSDNTLNSLGVTVAGSGFTLANQCGTSLPPNGTCTFSVTFSPTGGGTQTGSVTVTDSDPSSPQLAGLVGTGTSGAVGLSPPFLTFAARLVGTTSPGQSFTVTNSGSTPLSMISILASGDYAQTNNCPTSLSAGASCTVTVTFTPSAEGTRRGFVTLSDTDPTNLQTETIGGTGVNRTSIVSVSPRQASLTFTETKQFQAFINGGGTTDVTWYVDKIAGGNSQVGTITGSGVYTPPQAVGTHRVEAIDNSDSSQTASAPVVVTNFPGAFTYHYDNSRTGQNTQETVLTTGNVNSTQFGKLFSYPVDGEIYPDPLYVASVNIQNQGIHNVVYVATENDSLYAFDADGLSTSPLWHASFINPAEGITAIPYTDVIPASCGQMGPVIGITGTPVIDPTSGVLYVVVRTKEVTNGVASYPQRLHAIDITTGNEIAGSPVTIAASVPGEGEGNDGQGDVPFDDVHDNSRAGLLLLNGVVYLTWSSPCDQHPYHGWVIGYDEHSLQQVFVYNTSPNGQSGSIWGAGAGPSADADGNIYFLTSNGTFNVDAGGTDYGDALVKLGTDGGQAQVVDYFAPYNTASLTLLDLDLASGNVLLLPDQTVGPTHLAVGTGKEGTIYLVNRDSMGHFNPTDNNQIVQWLYRAVGVKTQQEPYFGMPAYWQNNLYFWGESDNLQQFRLFQGLLSQSAIALGQAKSQILGPTPSVSSNSTLNGIVWCAEFQNQKPAVLRAYDAANVTRELYDSSQAGNRDKPGGLAVEYTVPTVANGKVYLATQSELDVYGLLP